MQTDESQPESKRIMPESETDDCLLFLSMIEKNRSFYSNAFYIISFN